MQWSRLERETETKVFVAQLHHVCIMLVFLSRRSFHAWRLSHTQCMYDAGLSIQKQFGCMVFVTHSQCVHDGCCTFTFSASAFVTILALWAYMMVVVLFTVCTEGILYRRYSVTRSHCVHVMLIVKVVACAWVCLCRNSSSSEPQHHTESPKGVPWQGTSQSTQDPDNFCTAVAAGRPWLYALTPEQRPLLWWHLHLDKFSFFVCCYHIWGALASWKSILGIRSIQQLFIMEDQPLRL